MGTRSLTVFLDENGTEILAMYRHYDGYPTGHGADLKAFLSDFVVVNGYNNETPKRAANGMNCLVAEVIAHFKEGIGNIYVYPAGTRNCGEEYIYTVYYKDGNIALKLQAGCVTFFGFPGTEQANMPVLFDSEIAEFDPETVEKAWQNRENDPPNDFLEKAKQNQQKQKEKQNAANQNGSSS